MAGLEELFAFGTLSKEFTIGNTKMRLNVLDAKHLQDALNASYGMEETAKFLDYKKQVLARSVSQINEVTLLKDKTDPQPGEVANTIEALNKFHVIVINKMYDFYDELDTEIKKDLDEKVKK
jgi:hypothetical protein